MVLVSYIYNFIYIKNYKVAGTSAESFFEKYCIEPDNNYKAAHESDEIITKYGIIGTRMTHKQGNFYNHMPATEIKQLVGHNIFSKFLKFCVIRNPYDKMVSSYHFRGNKYDENIKSNFKKFALENKCNDMDRISIDKEPICDFYIRFENLKDDIIMLCEKLGIKNYDINDLPTFKSGFRKEKIHYSKYYDEETKQIVYNNHKSEIDYFKYSFEQI